MDIFNQLHKLNLSSVQKRATLKLAVDLVKADNIIHSKEISVLESIQKGLGLSQAEIDLIHYITLSEAISVIREMEDDSLNCILSLFNHIMKADSDIDFEENLLLSTINMACLPNSKNWANIVSAENLDSSIPDRQIIYLEKKHSADAHRVLDDMYDNLLISKALGDIGFELFYLPNVIKSLGVTSSVETQNDIFHLLQKSMEFLVPSGDKIKVNNLKNTLSNYTIEAFFKVFISRYGLDPDIFPSEAFILIKVRDNNILDDENVMRPVVDFLCLDISSDIKKRILEFVSYFDEKPSLLPYDGYFKLLYDELSCEAKLSCDITIDKSLNFCIEELGMRKIAFESSPQARTLYLLLLSRGKNGIHQSLFIKGISLLKSLDIDSFSEDGCFDIDLLKDHLRKLRTAEAYLVLNTISIYQTVSTKDEHKLTFINYITSILSHRSSLKTYVNKAFGSIVELANPEQYFIKYNKESDYYYLEVSPSRFKLLGNNGEYVQLQDSWFWTILNNKNS
ncbi:MAG: hypothetical protein MJZ16_02215 [Bacteroidales bacterium]|nr:hypothetical protein [Bacteroidales bacterium]